MKRLVLAAAAGALVLGTTVPAKADATGDVRAAMQKFASVQSFEIVTQNEGKTATMDMTNRPAAVHMSGGGMEMINAGGATYMKMGGSWKKYPSSSGMPFSDPIRHFADKANQIKATDLGMKSVGGETLHAYKIVDSGDGGTLFIGGDGLPHRFEGNDHSVVRITKFNAIAPIHAPI